MHFALLVRNKNFISSLSLLLISSAVHTSIVIQNSELD